MEHNVIKLGIGDRGHRLSIIQGAGNGSAKGHHVEVALLDGLDQFVNTGHWWHAATYDQIQDEYFDDVITHVKAEELKDVIAMASAWVKKVGEI
tara:strand:- start:56 stop:337 length:282 start_codon:yes stop_codon:yes gene_type:complete